MPKSSTGIKGHSQVVGLFLFKNMQQGVGKAVNAGGRFAMAGCPTGGTAGSQRKVSPVS